MDNVKLFEKISPLIFDYLKRIIFFIVSDKEMAKDVFQDTLIQAWRHIDQLQDEEKVKAWAKTIAIRTAQKEIAKGRRLRDRIFSVPVEDFDFLHGTDSAEDVAIRREEVREAEEFMEGLDAKTRCIFALHGELELTFEEIGKYMNIPPGTAKTRYYRAIGRYHKSREQE